MSAGGLARLGVRCADASTGMATLGVYCGALVVPPIGPQPGGGESRRKFPSEHPNKAIAMREDEDIIAVIQALLSKKH